MFLLRRKSDGKFWKNVKNSLPTYSKPGDKAWEDFWLTDPSKCRPFPRTSDVKNSYPVTRTLKDAPGKPRYPHRNHGVGCLCPSCVSGEEPKSYWEQRNAWEKTNKKRRQEQFDALYEMVEMRLSIKDKS